MNQHLRLIGLFVAVWATLFVVSLDHRALGFRPSDVLRDPIAPVFLPDQDVTQESYGDLAYKNHLPEFEHTRKIRFRTDEHGYRNPRYDTTPRVVVLGDSFVIGVSLDGADTVTTRMTEHLGEPVYNFGCYESASIARFLDDPRFEAEPPEVVILLLAARHAEAIESKTTVTKRSAWAQTPPLSWLLDVPEAIMRVKRPLERDNGLTHFAQTALATIRYRVTGSVDRGQVLTVEGERKLALTPAEQKLYDAPEKRRLAWAADGIARFRDQLAARGTTLLYSQIPEPGILYEDLYVESRPVPRPRFHDLLFAALAERGVACVDLLPRLEAERFPYLFLPDDTHWNPRCTDLVAQTLAERVRPLLD